MQYDPQTFRCFAEPAAEGWRAVCIDFHVEARGPSFEEAKERLRDAVIEAADAAVAAAPPGAEMAKLLWRPAPIADRMKFYW
ncbi:MAG: hypothetical protein K8I02_00920, partial [Candidatus Methylomirabilis sp.]|nr:hypothetical protein [Deltaproteobacteria bacterium]